MINRKGKGEAKITGFSFFIYLSTLIR